MKILRGPFAIFHEVEGMMLRQGLYPLSAPLLVYIPSPYSRQALCKLLFVHVTSIFPLKLALSWLSLLI
jgi:hypothetical protein